MYKKHLSPRALLTALRIPTSPVGYLLSSPSLQDQLGGQLRTPLRDMSGSSLSSIGETSYPELYNSCGVLPKIRINQQIAGASRFLCIGATSNGADIKALRITQKRKPPKKEEHFLWGLEDSSHRDLLV